MLLRSEIVAVGGDLDAARVSVLLSVRMLSRR